MIITVLYVNLIVVVNYSITCLHTIKEIALSLRSLLSLSFFALWVGLCHLDSLTLLSSLKNRSSRFAVSNDKYVYLRKREKFALRKSVF